MKSARTIIKTVGQLKSDRANHENTWKEIARVLRPMRRDFDKTAVGQRRHQRIFDSSPLVALSNFKSGLYGMMTSPSNRWFDLGLQDEDLQEFESVKDWLKETSDIVFTSFAPSASNFYNQVPQLYADVGAFGTSIFFSKEIEGTGRIFDSCRSLGECYIDTNQFDEVDCVYREFKLTSRQAYMQFGEDVGIAVKNDYEKNGDTKWDYIHAVYPNEDVKEGIIGPDGMDFLSVYVEVKTKKIIRTGGYRDNPYQVPRWDVYAGEIYGRGQGEVALADVLTGQEIRKTNLLAAQRAANPALLAQDETALNGALRGYPGGVTYGGLDSAGKPMVRPLYEGKNVQIALEYENMIRDAIKDSFYFSLMQIAGRPNMTATEYLGHQEEKLRLLGPNMGRIQTEALAPMIKRRFGILMTQGRIPPAPEELQGQELEIKYISPLARMQKTTEAQAAMRVFEGVSAAAQFKPAILDRFDEDAYIERLADGFGATGLIHSRQETDKNRKERAAQEQQDKMMGSAKDLSQAVKNVADAGAVAQEAA